MALLGREPNAPAHRTRPPTGATGLVRLRRDGGRRRVPRQRAPQGEPPPHSRGCVPQVAGVHPKGGRVPSLSALTPRRPVWVPAPSGGSSSRGWRGACRTHLNEFCRPSCSSCSVPEGAAVGKERPQRGASGRCAARASFRLARSGRSSASDGRSACVLAQGGAPRRGRGGRVARRDLSGRGHRRFPFVFFLFRWGGPLSPRSSPQPTCPRAAPPPRLARAGMAAAGCRRRPPP